MTADRPRLSVSARYCLEVLSRGQRSYSSKNQQVCALARKELAEATTSEGEDGTRNWVITDAGRAALETYAAPTKPAASHKKRRS